MLDEARQLWRKTEVGTCQGCVGGTCIKDLLRICNGDRVRVRMGVTFGLLTCGKEDDPFRKRKQA